MISRSRPLVLPLLAGAWLSVTGLFPAVAVAADLGAVADGGDLVLPLDLDALEGEIAIEIGAVDVTDFANIVDGRIVIDLDGLVGAGAHEVTIYLFQGDDVEVLETYSFSLGSGSAGAATLADTGPVPGGDSSWSVEVEATHEADLRWINSETELDGSSSGQIRVNNGSGTVTGYVGYLASSRRNQQINRKPFNFTDYSLEYQETRGGTVLTATMGHQALSFDPVLVDGINRRGLSFSVARTDDRLRADFFALRTQDLLGAANVTGLEDPQDQMFGARLAFRPIASSDLTFSMQTYSGTGVPFGGLVAGEGSGMSFGFDSSAQGGRLRYGAHFGMTRWDEDATGPLAPRPARRRGFMPITT